ncbi:MAG: hypothetical protein ACI906_002705 [Candidatus Latescibacterota bacterium]|jgi:hypothetical protein
MGRSGRLERAVKIGYDKRLGAGYVELWDGNGNSNSILTE